MAVGLKNKLESHDRAGKKFAGTGRNGEEKRENHISSERAVACRATPTQRFWILWLFWMFPTGAVRPSCEAPISPFRLCNWRTPFLCCQNNRKQSSKRMALIPSMPKRAVFVSNDLRIVQSGLGFWA